METNEIKEFYQDGLISIKVLQRVCGIGRSGIFNRFMRDTKFSEREIEYLRSLFLPLFQKLYGFEKIEDGEPILYEKEVMP
jgi:hypothetical protein